MKNFPYCLLLLQILKLYHLSWNIDNKFQGGELSLLFAVASNFDFDNGKWLISQHYYMIWSNSKKLGKFSTLEMLTLSTKVSQNQSADAFKSQSYMITSNQTARTLILHDLKQHQTIRQVLHLGNVDFIHPKLINLQI